MRDEFSEATKRLLAQRVCCRCSRPDCRQPTSGPQLDPTKALNVGVAAHITAASPGFARYDPNLTSEQRSSHENGIWLCQTCGKLVDNDEAFYTVEKLRAWKQQAEETARCEVEHGRSQSGQRRAGSNLPVALSSFIGRERELATARQLLAENRLLTLIGTGGCGKTRLALKLAADVSDQFGGRVWLVELASLSDPNVIDQAVAGALGVTVDADLPLRPALAGQLGSEPLLLVLDNCEHLVEACADFCETLLKTCPNLRILVSSRERFRIAVEQVLDVPPLTLPATEPPPSLEQIASSEAVTLFLDRARACQPSFRIGDENSGLVLQICRELDGIPLAIELAAARVKVLPLREIASRLTDRFRLLRQGSRTAAPRQQTLEACIAWSHDLLSEAERVLFRRLTVFAGGWSLSAAHAVCAEEAADAVQVFELLSQLAEKSLISRDDLEDEPRYRFLETVRQYASDRLVEAGEAAAVWERHCDYFFALAAQGGETTVEEDRAAWAAQMRREHGNLQAACAWTVQESGEDSILSGPIAALSNSAYPYLSDLLLELSLSLPESASYWFRDLLTRYLEDAPEAARSGLVERINRELDPSTEPERLRAAIWVAIHLGYRDEGTVRRLLVLAGMEGQMALPLTVRDDALWALVWLRHADTPALETQLEERLDVGSLPSDILLQAARSLRSPRLLPKIIALYGRVTDDDEPLSMVLRVLADTAEAHPDSAQGIWETIFSRDSPRVRAILCGSRDIIPRIDARETGEYLLRCLAPEDAAASTADIPQRSPYWGYFRLLELCLPEQLAGLRSGSARETTAVLEVLRADATFNSGATHFGETVESLRKRRSWAVILRLGLPQFREWLLEALDESAEFVLVELCEIAGFLRVAETVRRLREIVAQPNPPRALGCTAIRALGSIGTPEALEALIQSRVLVGRRAGVRIEETVPQALLDALATVCVGLGKAERLVELLEDPACGEGLCHGCAAALEQIAAADPAQIHPLRARIAGLLRRGAAKYDVTKRYLCGVLGCLTPNAQEANLLRRLASSGRAGELYAKQALASAGLLSRSPKLLASLGLKVERGRWRLDRPLGWQEAFVLGLLYQREAERFAPAICNVLDSDAADAATLVVRRIGGMGRGKQPSPVMDALVRRATRVNTSCRAESEVLEALAAVAPERLLADFTESQVTQWYTPAREAFARVLSLAELSEANLEPAVAMLSALLDDEEPSVRAAAGQSLASIAPARLRIGVDLLAASEDVEQRLRGAEAASWLPEDAEALNCLRRAQADPEERVRKAGDENAARRRARFMASAYLQQVLSYASDSLLDCWHYGQALIAVGDGDTVTSLARAARDPSRPPHHRAWLTWLAKHAEKQWQASERDRMLEPWS